MNNNSRTTVCEIPGTIRSISPGTTTGTEGGWAGDERDRQRCTVRFILSAKEWEADVVGPRGLFSHIGLVTMGVCGATLLVMPRRVSRVQAV